MALDPAVAERVQGVRARLAQAAARAGRRAEEIRLVAVGKAMPVEDLEAAIASGVTDLAENYLQEAGPKIEALRSRFAAVRWHLTGHLQANKVRDAVRWFDVIQTVDSAALLQRLERLTEKPLAVLVQIRLGDEAQKSGVDPAALPALLASARGLRQVQVTGLMTLPPPADDPEASRPWFAQLRALARQHGLAELSMGMSHDFEVAIEEGATMVRIGHAIFGDRPHP